ncbi:MAG: hypothetical protein ABIF08_00505, partial [Nanoarchaeota archaeon]
MDIFQVYKIILGLIVAAMFIAFISTFLGDYMGLNTETMTYKAMNSFRDAVHDVYVTGDTLVFNELSKERIPECNIRSTIESEPTRVSCSSIRMPFFTPLAFSKEKDYEYTISRNEVDYGWTKFYMV